MKTQFKPAPFKKLIAVLETELVKPTKKFKFDMSGYGEKNRCGTSCCAMGTAVVRDIFPGIRYGWVSDGDAGYELAPMGKDACEIDFDDLGMSGFGLTSREYDGLFSSYEAMHRDLMSQIAYMKVFLSKKTRKLA